VCTYARTDLPPRKCLIFTYPWILIQRCRQALHPCSGWGGHASAGQIHGLLEIPPPAPDACTCGSTNTAVVLCADRICSCCSTPTSSPSSEPNVGRADRVRRAAIDGDCTHDATHGFI
jgi:hypothetical protein